MARSKNQKGYTLIELLTVTAIIGILAGLATQAFIENKKKGFDARAKADLQNVAKAEEAYYSSFEEYLDCTNATCTLLPGIIALSDGVLLQITSTASAFTGTASHPNGSGIVYRWDSANGGLQ